MRPISVDAEGRFLSHAVSAGRVVGGQPRRRRRRDVGIGPDEWEEPKGEHVADREKLYYNVTIFGREFHLRLRHNTRLVAPGAKMEWHDDSDSTRHTEPLQDECLYVGDITDTPGATVAISNCDGLVSVWAAMFNYTHQRLVAFYWDYFRRRKPDHSVGGMSCEFCVTHV